MPVIIEFSRCIDTYSSAKFELYYNNNVRTASGNASRRPLQTVGILGIKQESSPYRDYPLILYVFTVLNHFVSFKAVFLFTTALLAFCYYSSSNGAYLIIMVAASARFVLPCGFSFPLSPFIISCSTAHFIASNANPFT